MLVVLVGNGCGDAGGGGADADRAVAPAGAPLAWTVGLGDLPPGWQEESVPVATGGGADACVIDGGDPAVLRDASRRVFTPTDASGLSIDVVSVRTTGAEVAASAGASAASGATGDCVRDALEAAASAGTFRLDDLNVSAAPDASGGFTQLRYTMTMNGTAVTVAQEQFVLAHDDRLAVVGFTAADREFPADVREAVLEALRTRLA